MELPYFKAFPTDWEITMRKAGIPPAKRGTVYRLIFFAWQEQGLNLTEDETYERRMRVLAQGFGLSYCRFKPYLAYYKALSECQNGLWLPSFLLQQFQHAMRFQSGFGSKSEQGQSNAETDSEQSQNKVRTKSEQSQNNISGLSSLPAIPLKHEQEHDQEREHARAREEESASLISPEVPPASLEADEPEETTAIGMFRAAFDDNAATIHAQTVIESAGITDLESWAKALRVWKTNGYKPRNLAGLIDNYNETAAKATKARKGWSSGPGATAEDIAKLIRAVTASGESSKPAVAGGKNGSGNGRMANGASGNSPGSVAIPLRDGAPYTGPETLLEASKRRRLAVRVVEKPSEPPMECPF